MPKKITWVLIADGQRARVLKNDGPGKGLVPAIDHEFIGAAIPTREIVSDRPGRSFDSKGAGRHSMEPHTDPHRYEKRQLAKQIADELEGYHQKGAFNRLVIVAAPQTLGDLRAELSAGVQKTISGEVAKDLTKIPVHELPGHLAEVIVV